MIRAVAILALVVTATSSQPPLPTAAKAGQAKQEQTGGENSKAQPGNQPAKKSPPTVTQTKPEITVRYDQQFGQKDKGDAPIDYPSWAVAFFTLGLLILARCQYLAMDRQAKLMRRQAVLMGRQLASMKTTGDDTHTLALAATKTASAAQKSADASSEQLTAIVNVARARLTVDHISGLPIMLIRGPNTISVTIVNRGYTPATEIIFSGTWVIAPKGHVVNWSSVDPSDEQMQRVDVIGAGLRAFVTIELPAFGDKEVRSLLDDEAELHLLGDASYDDVFQSDDLSMNFAALWSPIEEKWKVVRQGVD